MICSICEGSGYHWVTCSICRGSGWVDGRPGGEICCGGEDRIECETCQGTGEIDDDEACPSCLKSRCTCDSDYEESAGK